MPVTYTNRRGVTYYLCRSPVKTGKLPYYFARRPQGEPVDEVPPGYRIGETVNGQVYLEPDRPVPIRPDELAAVEEAIRRLPKPDCTARYHRTARLLNETALTHAYGFYPPLLDALARVQLLVLDDWLRDPLTRPQAQDLLDILDDRYDRASTLAVSQVPVAEWHGRIPDSPLADAILDHLVHNAYRLELQGDSRRKSDSLVITQNREAVETRPRKSESRGSASSGADSWSVLTCVDKPTASFRQGDCRRGGSCWEQAETRRLAGHGSRAALEGR